MRELNENRRRLSNLENVEDLPDDLRVKPHQMDVLEKKVEVQAKRRASQIAGESELKAVCATVSFAMSDIAF